MQLHRRHLLTGLVSIALGAPSRALAQRSSLPVIGFLNNASADAYGGRVKAFHEGLKEQGYEEGKNVLIDYRWANGDYKRLPEMAAELVRKKVSVIAATGGTVSGLTAKQATTTIPIVFALAVDPVSAGIVKSINQPEGNLTGVGTLAAQIAPKRLELLREVVPSNTLFGLLLNPTNPNYPSLRKEMEEAVGTLKVKAKFYHAADDKQLEQVFLSMDQEGARGLVVGPDGYFNIRIARIASLALKYKVPAIYQYNEFATAGGLMSYGGSETAPYRQAGVYTGRILQGELPRNLPIQQVTRVELMINLQTAKYLGISFPMALLGRADEVIE